MCVKPESVPSRTTPVRGNVIVRVCACVCVCHLTLRLQMCVQICSSLRLGGSSVCTGERCPQSAVIKCRRSCSTPSSVMSRRCVRRSSTETRTRGTCSSSRRGHTVLLPTAGREIKFCQSITRQNFNNSSNVCAKRQTVVSSTRRASNDSRAAYVSTPLVETKPERSVWICIRQLVVDLYCPLVVNKKNTFNSNVLEINQLIQSYRFLSRTLLQTVSPQRHSGFCTCK